MLFDRKGIGFIFWALIFFLTGCLTTVVALLWEVKGSGFFHVRAVEIAQLFWSGVVAVVLAIYVNKTLATFFRQRDTVCALLNDVKSALVEVLNLGLEYTASPDNGKTSAIDRAVRNASMQISLVLECKNGGYASEFKGLDEEAITNEFLEFKKLLTGDPYKTGKAYSDTQREMFIEKYELLMDILLRAILGIYRN
jgi:hypothetical protein